jgi:hypothetical protein
MTTTFEYKGHTVEMKKGFNKWIATIDKGQKIIIGGQNGSAARLKVEKMIKAQEQRLIEAESSR